MGQATPLAIRQMIVELRQAGKKHAEISEELHIPQSTIKLIWSKYQKQGETGLSNNYSNCGPQSIRSNALMYRATLWLKRQHPTWGAGRIRLELLTRYDNSIIPSERTMQRWFLEKKIN
jgi:transposase